MPQVAAWSSPTPSTATFITLLKILLLVLGSFTRVPLSYAAPVSLFDDDLPKTPDDPSLWAYLGVAAALVLLGGAFAGLTIAYVSKNKFFGHCGMLSSRWPSKSFALQSYKSKQQKTYDTLVSFQQILALPARMNSRLLSIESITTNPRTSCIDLSHMLTFQPGSWGKTRFTFRLSRHPVKEARKQMQKRF